MPPLRHSLIVPAGVAHAHWLHQLSLGVSLHQAVAARGLGLHCQLRAPVAFLPARGQAPPDDLSRQRRRRHFTATVF